MNNNFEECVKKCVKQDREIIYELSKLLTEVNDHHTTCNVVKTGGTVAGVAGTGMLLGSLMMAPFTCGASLTVALGGAALSVGGGVTNIVTDVVDGSKTKKFVSKIGHIVNSKTQIDGELKRQIESFTQVVDQLVSSGVSHDSAIKATLRAVANGTVDLNKAAHNPNLIRSLAITSKAFQVNYSTIKSLPLIGKAVHLSAKKTRFIHTFFGYTSKSSLKAWKTIGKITTVASIAFTVIDVALLIRDWITDHPTMEMITDVQGQLRNETRRLETLVHMLDQFTDKVGYIEILDQYPCVGASVEVVDLCYAVLAFDLDDCKRIMEKLGIEFLDSELDNKSKIINYFIDNGVSKGFTKSEINNLISQVVKKPGKRGSAKLRALYNAINDKLSADEKEGKESKKSKRGEHVINNGVIDIYRDIINRFLWRRLNSFELNQVRSVSQDSQVYRDYEESLTPSTQNNIRNVMIAQIPDDYRYLNANAFSYGYIIEILKESSVEHMCELWDNYDNYPVNSGTHHTAKIQSALNLFISQSVFVDHEALAFWQRQHRDNTVFDGAENEVKNMFYELYDKLKQWVSDLKRL